MPFTQRLKVACCAAVALYLVTLISQQVVTTREEQNIVALVPLLADLGLHHIPVVNQLQQLTGLISQSDLIAAFDQLQLQQDALTTEP